MILDGLGVGDKRQLPGECCAGGMPRSMAPISDQDGIVIHAGGTEDSKS